jgi:hypothetical protein
MNERLSQHRLSLAILSLLQLAVGGAAFAQTGGTITGRIVAADIQFNLGTDRVPAAPGSENLFVGTGAGNDSTTGIENAAFGRFAGSAITAGSGNSLFGFAAGRFDLIRRLRPVAFTWIADSRVDLGLIAEEVAEVEPLLVTRNEEGDVEGVKYDRLGVILINAVNAQQLHIESQQPQIDEQKALIERQQLQIEALRILVCSQERSAAICLPRR